MPTGNMYRVQAVYTGVAGTPYYATMHFEAGYGTAEDAAQKWRDFLSYSPDTCRENLVMQAITEVDIVNPVTNETVGREGVTVPGVAYTSTVEALPPSSQILIRWLSGVFVNGREQRGRTFLPGWTTAHVADGNVINTLRSGINTKINDFLDFTQAKPVVYSKKAGAWQDMSDGNVWDQFAVLRSRRD